MKQEPIRIAQIIGKWVGGGVEAVVMNYYRHIDREKIQFDFICDDDSTNIPYEEIEKLGGRVILIPPYQKVIKYHKELKKILKEGKYKIVHSHINTLSVFSLFAAKCAGVPVRIAHSHSTTNKKEKKKNLLKQVLCPFSKLFATDYMCCSELAGRWLFGDKEYEKGNVYLLNNAIDLDKFKYDEKIRKEVREEIEIKDSTLVIGHIGRFVEQKNHDFLIDIFAEVHKEKEDSVLLLVGQGPLQEKTKEKVERLGLQDSVKFLGQRTDVERLYQAFDLFLFPSLYEGLGMVLIEAQCSGLPCIASMEVPSIAKVTDAVEFISLYENAEVWSKTILSDIVRNERNNNLNEVKIHGYDIEQESSKLENKYFNYICHEKSVMFYTERWMDGGIEAFIMNTIENINNIKFSILTSQKETVTFDKKLVDRNCELISIHKKNKKNPIYRTICSLIRLRKFLKIYKPNILHINIYNSIGLYYAHIANKVGIQNIIVHAHNTGIDNDKFGIKRFANLLFKKLFTSEKYKYMACSMKAAEFCLELKKIDNDIIIIKNGIDSDKFLFNSKIRSEYRKKLEIDNDTLLFGHVGRFVEQKNHEYLIDIFNEYNKINIKSKLLLIGNGPLMDKIKKICLEKGILNNVIFLGNTTEVNKYMQAMDFFLFPSVYEGLGIVLIEAQASGLFCIASNEVPYDVKITDNICFNNLDDIEGWINSIKNNLNYKRNKIKEIMNSSGFNINDSVKRVANVYEVMLLNEK